VEIGLSLAVRFGDEGLGDPKCGRGCLYASSESRLNVSGLAVPMGRTSVWSRQIYCRRPEDMHARLARLFEKGLIQPWRSRRQAMIRGAPSWIAIKEGKPGEKYRLGFWCKSQPRLPLQTAKQEPSLRIRISGLPASVEGQSLPLSHQRGPLDVCTQPQTLLGSLRTPPRIVSWLLTAGSSGIGKPPSDSWVPSPVICRQIRGRSAEEGSLILTTESELSRLHRSSWL
jgi:hypothetical protein